MQLERVLAYLAKVTHVDDAAFCPLYIGGERLGCVNAAWRERLLTHEPALFQLWRDGLRCLADGDYAHISRALQDAACRWRDADWLNGWRNENFRAARIDGTPCFELERAAFRPLGLTSHAVHLNGLTHADDGGMRMWLGRRSPYKAVDPNRMDNMVGGGVAAGESIEVAREREGREEAGLPAALLADLPLSARILAERPVQRGLHREWLHVFDVWLAPGFAPLNQDGEVAEHVCLDFSEVEALLVEERFMIDAALVAADCLARHGYWGADGGLRVRRALAGRYTYETPHP
jgi:8-oxo-dGTP pyrophosphatase MutT (NUDIX family)